MNIREGEKPWREHLMGVDGCVKNPRRIAALKKAKPTTQPTKQPQQQQQKSVVIPTTQVNMMKKAKKLPTTVK